MNAVCASTVSSTQPIRVKNCQPDSANQVEELCCEERVGSKLSRRSTPSIVGDLRDAIAGVIQNLLQTDKHTAEFVRRFRYEMHIQTDRREKTSILTTV